jgi:hypothetical protein
VAALNEKQALEAAQAIFNGPRLAEADRLNVIAEAMKPPHKRTPRVEMPKKAVDALQHLAWKSQSGFLPLVVDVFSQNMKIDGYRSGRSADDSAAWAFWQRNGFDARQTGVHRSALINGASYVRLSKGGSSPVMRGRSARELTARRLTSGRCSRLMSTARCWS